MKIARPLAALVLAALAPAALAQACPHRGELDDMYCDADKDLLADPPTDPKKFKNPAQTTHNYKKNLIFKYEKVFEGINLDDFFISPILLSKSNLLNRLEVFYDD